MPNYIRELIPTDTEQFFARSHQLQFQCPQQPRRTWETIQQKVDKFEFSTLQLENHQPATSGHEEFANVVASESMHGLTIAVNKLWENLATKAWTKKMQEMNQTSIINHKDLNWVSRIPHNVY